MFVLDTNVVSELRKAKSRKADSHVVDWMGEVDTKLTFITVITFMEIEIGVQRVARRDAKQGNLLQRWLDEQVLPAFAGRILSVDLAVARRCAALHVPNARAERDALIAATAFVHRMTVVTRNVADFASTGVPLINPWAAASPP